MHPEGGRTFGLALVATLLCAWSCGERDAAPPTGRAIADSPSAQVRVDGLHSRFLLPAASVASGFELADGRVHVLIPAVQRVAARAATVTLPVHAGEPVRLEDDTSHLAVTFSLRGASDSEIATSAGIALYPGALAGADVLHRVHAEGTEDYVVF